MEAPLAGALLVLLVLVGLVPLLLPLVALSWAAGTMSKLMFLGRAGGRGGGCPRQA